MDEIDKRLMIFTLEQRMLSYKDSYCETALAILIRRIKNGKKPSGIPNICLGCDINERYCTNVLKPEGSIDESK